MIAAMSYQPLSGKTAVVFGVANKRSIAYAVAKAWHDAGANLIFNYQGERNKDSVAKIAKSFGEDLPVYPCLLYTSPSPRDKRQSRMPSSA